MRKKKYLYGITTALYSFFTMLWFMYIVIAFKENYLDHMHFQICQTGRQRMTQLMKRMKKRMMMMMRVVRTLERRQKTMSLRRMRKRGGGRDMSYLSRQIKGARCGYSRVL